MSGRMQRFESLDTGPAGPGTGAFADRVTAAEAVGRIGARVTVAGWVHRIRSMGGIVFVVLRDRSGMIQLVYADGTAPELGPEYVVKAAGTVTANPKSPGGAEIEVESTEVLSTAAQDLPFPVSRDPDTAGLDSILDNRIVSLRNPKIRSIFELQSSILRYLSEFLHGRGYREIKTSKLIGSGTEGGTGLFTVEYFDRTVYLAQSPQFYKQAMISSGLERVFEISHAYRAEKHDTSRHLNEYVSIDIETAFIESELDLIAFERELLAHVFDRIAENDRPILDLWGVPVTDGSLMAKVPVLSCEEVKRIVRERAGRPIYDITPEAERLVCDWADEAHGVPACFINDWPRRARPFYTYPRSVRTTMSFDLIFRGLEITTGGRRINEYRMLLDALPRFGLTEQGLGEYPNIFKYGCPPHGGFAIGLERLTQKILGLSNVKEASPFPRDRKRVTP